MNTELGKLMTVHKFFFFLTCMLLKCFYLNLLKTTELLTSCRTQINSDSVAHSLCVAAIFIVTV